MKKTIFTLAALSAVVFGQVATATASEPLNPTSATAENWTKAPKGVWPGMMNGKTYWYKLDMKGNLEWSTDGKKWSGVADNMWADKDGKWMKIVDNKLVWSTDMGKSWSEVPGWKWMGSDGKWYKFNKDWSVWMNA